MYESTVAIPLPQILYRRLKHLADITQRPLESLVIQALDNNVPQLIDDLPSSMRSDLADLEQLADDSLWKVANSIIDLDKQQEYTNLLDKQRNAMIAVGEERRLEELFQQANRHMIRKAYANALLRWRGHLLPELASELISE